MKILIIEDQENLAQLLKKGLEKTKKSVKYLMAKTGKPLKQKLNLICINI